MGKKLFLLGFLGIFLLELSLNEVAAYHDHGDYINSYSYSSSKSYGYAGNIYTTDKFYDRSTVSRYLSDGTFEKTTTYINTVRRSQPRFGYNYRPNIRYGNYNRLGSGYGNYYNGPGYRFGGYYNRIPDWRYWGKREEDKEKVKYNNSYKSSNFLW